MFPDSKEGDWLNIYFTLIKIMFEEIFGDMKVFMILCV